MVAHRDLDLSQSSQARKLKVKITIECQILVPWVKTPVCEFQSDRIVCGKKPLGSYTNIHWLTIYEETTMVRCDLDSNHGFPDCWPNGFTTDGESSRLATTIMFCRF